MRKFLAEEKPKQASFKVDAPYFSSGARVEGIYKNHPYDFCLPREFAEENLFPGIRQSILAYFDRNQIKWHDGQDGMPSNHLCDSQVCCANFLFPFVDKPQPLAKLLRPIFPTIHEMLPIEDGQYVAFEWIGQQNYLGEIQSRNRARTRGANFTSADAAVRFRHTDGHIQVVLIEWKYTEAYSSTPLEIAKSGRSRVEIYRHLFEEDDCPLAKECLASFKDLFFEPFYQFMRQQFLAHEMEKAHELDTDIVSLLHISPAHNLDFKTITSPALQPLGSSATDVWSKLVKTPGRFISVNTEYLFGRFDVSNTPELRAWQIYITTRYGWIKG
jgi:hypothetical protein